MRKDVVPAALILIATAAVVYAAVPRVGHWERHASDLDQYAERYGGQKHTEHGEEWLIRDFFGDKRNGFFVDVGAHHYRTFSNTYFLETALGWSGVAVEPQTQFADEYARYRPNTKFRPFFVSDVSDAQAKLYVLKRNTLVTSANPEFVKQFGSGAREISAPTITLDDLLASERVERIDFLSMDIETWEPKALAGFDIRRFQPALVCVEAHDEVTQEILDYFADRGYVVVGKYLGADPYNLYFMPRRKADAATAAR
jgi:FkbM family methyltransferase